MRLIDADELWARLQKSMIHHIVTNTLFNTVKATIDGTPTIDAEPVRHGEWIPVSERLPEPNQYVLVTYKTTDEVQVCRYCDDGSRNPWYSLIDECRAWNNVVLAWMPLPKPWKGADDESKRD